jgi:predicted aspartyl protease
MVTLALPVGPVPVLAAPPEIAYREVWGYGVVVPVQIDGRGPFEFLLDTGTTSTVIRFDLAARLGVAAATPVAVTTATGRRTATLGRVRTLAFGPSVLEDVEVVVHDMPAVRQGDARIVGILGQSALSRLSFTLDHRRRRIAFGPAHLPLTPQVGRVGERPVLRADLACDGGGAVRLALDSGIGGLLLYDTPGTPPVTATHWVTAETNAGTQALRGGQLDALCVGALRLRQVGVAVGEGGAPHPPGEDGLLPTSLFARVHFDGPAGTIGLETW